LYGETFSNGGGSTPNPFYATDMFDFDEIFGESFFERNNFPRHEHFPREERHTLDVTLQDLYLGKTVKMSLEKDIICSVCQGRMYKRGAKTTACNTCGGIGNIRSFRQFGPIIQPIFQPCRQCKGSGTVFRERDKCRKCNAKGTIKARKSIEIHIDPGMTSGTKITLRGEGDQAVGREAPQDLIFTLACQPHPVFERRGNDLFAECTISLTEALCGFNKVLLIQLDKRELKVIHPAGLVITPGQVLKIVGEGMPQLRRPYDKGSLHIKFNVEFPKEIPLANVAGLERLLPIRPLQRPEIGVVEHVVISPSEYKNGLSDLLDSENEDSGEDDDDDEGRDFRGRDACHTQ